MGGEQGAGGEPSGGRAGKGPCPRLCLWVQSPPLCAPLRSLGQSPPLPKMPQTCPSSSPAAGL